MTGIHTHVARVTHRGGPGADQGRRRLKQSRTLPGTTQMATRFTPGFTPDIVSTLRQSHERTRASDGRTFAGLIKSMAPFVALLSGMMMTRNECTADDNAGTGQHYTDRWDSEEA